MPLPLDDVRRQFPILSQKIEGHPLLYLDSAATAQKPEVVLERMRQFYAQENGNAHRGMHVLAERATEVYESARETIRGFLNAARVQEIVITKSCTEAVNLVARSWGRANLQRGDAVVLSLLEHHSNIVPWLQLQEEIGIELRWIDIDDGGHLRADQYAELLADGKVRLVAITMQSNVLGTRPPLKNMIREAHAHGALVLVDAAQSIAHAPTDVQDLDCDFLAFSGHKLYGPTGIGVLYGRQSLLTSMPPFLGGGMMIQEVHQDRFTPADIPARFEAGTPPVAEAAGLAAAIEWLAHYSWKDIEAHEQALLSSAEQMLLSVPGVTLLGTGPRSGCVSFTVDGVHPHDLTEILGRQGICLRAGHHCAQPLHRRLGIPASTRLSVAIHNTEDDIASVGPALLQAIKRLLP